MLNEITVRQIQRHVQLKTPIPRICADVGVGRAVVYRLISEGFDERIERMKRKKRDPRPRTPLRSCGSKMLCKMRTMGAMDNYAKEKCDKWQAVK